MIKSSSSSLKRILQLPTNAQLPYNRINKPLSGNIIINTNHSKSYSNKNLIKSILLKNINNKNLNRSKKSSNLKLNNTCLKENKQNIKKGLKMISKNKYHNLTLQLQKPQISLRLNIDNNSLTEAMMEKSWKNYYKNVYNSQQLKEEKKKSKAKHDKFLQVLTNMNRNQKKKYHQRLSSKDKNRYYVNQMLIKINQGKKICLNIKSNQFNSSIRSVSQTDQARFQFQNQRIQKYLKNEEMLKSQDKVLENQKKQKLIFTTYKSSLNKIQKQSEINPQHNLRNLTNTSIIFSNNEKKNNIQSNYLNEINHQSKHQTNKMYSTQVSYEKNIDNKSILSNVKISQFFAKDSQFLQEDTVFFKQQLIQQNEKMIKNKKNQQLQKFTQSFLQKNKQKLSSQKRFLWKSKVPICNTTETKPILHEDLFRNIQTPKKELLFEKVNNKSNQNKNSSQFKILHNKIISSLNEIRTVQTKIQQNSSVQNSNQKIEQSVIIFKGSSDVDLNQNLSINDSPSPLFKKKLAVKLSYSAQKNNNLIEQQNLIAQQIKKNNRKYQFLQNKKEKKITEESNQEEESDFQQKQSSYKIKCVNKEQSLSFKEKILQIRDIKQIQSETEKVQKTEIQIQKQKSLIKEIKKGIVNFKNIKQTFEQLSFLLEKQYQRVQIKAQLPKKIKGKYQEDQLIKNQVNYQILDIFERKKGRFEILRLKKEHLQTSLDQLNGILMMELCSQVKFYQKRY